MVKLVHMINFQPLNRGFLYAKYCISTFSYPKGIVLYEDHKSHSGLYHNDRLNQSILLI